LAIKMSIVLPVYKTETSLMSLENIRQTKNYPSWHRSCKLKDNNLGKLLCQEGQFTPLNADTAVLPTAKPRLCNEEQSEKDVIYYYLKCRKMSRKTGQTQAFLARCREHVAKKAGEYIWRQAKSCPCLLGEIELNQKAPVCQFLWGHHEFLVTRIPQLS